MHLELKIIQDEIKHLKKLERKERKDKGIIRPKYDSNLNRQYISYLKRANVKGFGFELTEQHFINIDTLTCEYCGDEASGYDRVNSKLGYLLNNIVPCCWACNMMKSSRNVNDFLKHIEKIYYHTNKFK